jgi:hypothetical protein
MHILEEVRELASQLQKKLNELGPSREISTAKTKVDEAFLWALAAMNEDGPVLSMGTIVPRDEA